MAVNRSSNGWGADAGDQQAPGEARDNTGDRPAGVSCYWRSQHGGEVVGCAPGQYLRDTHCPHQLEAIDGLADGGAWQHSWRLLLLVATN
ncbi:hypothetical protein D3C71_1717320 [compost metagenome]